MASMQHLSYKIPIFQGLSICPTKRFPHRLERQKITKIGEKIGEEIGEKIGHCYFCNRSKMHHLDVTQPDYQTL